MACDRVESAWGLTVGMADMDPRLLCQPTTRRWLPPFKQSTPLTLLRYSVGFCPLRLSLTCVFPRAQRSMVDTP